MSADTKKRSRARADSISSPKLALPLPATKTSKLWIMQCTGDEDTYTPVTRTPSPSTAPTVVRVPLDMVPIITSKASTTTSSPLGGDDCLPPPPLLATFKCLHHTTPLARVASMRLPPPLARRKETGGHDDFLKALTSPVPVSLRRLVSTVASLCAVSKEGEDSVDINMLKEEIINNWHLLVPSDSTPSKTLTITEISPRLPILLEYLQRVPSLTSFEAVIMQLPHGAVAKGRSLRFSEDGLAVGNGVYCDSRATMKTTSGSDKKKKKPNTQAHGEAEEDVEVPASRPAASAPPTPSHRRYIPKVSSKTSPKTFLKASGDTEYVLAVVVGNNRHRMLKHKAVRMHCLHVTDAAEVYIIARVKISGPKWRALGETTPDACSCMT